MPRSKTILPEFWQWSVPIIVILIFVGILVYALTSIQPDAKSISTSAQTLIQAGEYEKAAEEWKVLVEAQPDNAEAFYQLGLLTSLLDPEQAAGYFNRAATLDPAYNERSQRFTSKLRLAEYAEDPAYQYIQVGQALAAEGEWSLALEAFHRARQANPLYAEAWAFYAQALFQLGQDGLPALQEALQLDPQSLAANVFMGSYWRAQGQPESALPYLKTALEVEPDNTSLLTDYGFTLAATGDIASALEQFQRISEIGPEDLDTWLRIAEFSLDHDLQVVEIGQPAARQAVLLAPHDPQALVLLGRVYSQQGDRLLALRFFQRAIEADPGYAPAHYYLGLHYLAHGDLQLAQEELQKTIDLAGEDPLALQAENILNGYIHSHLNGDEQ